MSAEKPHKRIRLDQIPKDYPFKVPEGYFEDFTARLNQRISEEETLESLKIKRPVPVFRSRLALAAAILALAAFSVVAVRYILNRNILQESHLNYASIVEQNIENYDIGQLSDEYTENMKEDTLRNNSAYSDAVITYLINDDVDLGLLIEDF